MSDVIEVVIRAKDDTSRGISSVRSGLSGLTNAFAPIKAIGTAAFLSVGAAAVGGFAMAMNAAIDMNASLEQSTMQFTTLMGDADLAAEHVAMLFELGAKTPFETGPIIAASKHLQVFGGAALNTQENLILVGDAAAAVGAPIDEVGFWIGRLYSNLQGGQPIGEAAMRLQELGLMTPQVRTQLEGMVETGASLDATWGVMTGSLGAFTGAMEMQSQSWAGLTSTIKDQLAMLAADTLKPFFELLKTGLASLSQWLASPEVQAGIQRLAEGFKTLIIAVTDFVTNSIIPFVQEHGPAIKAALIAIGVALAGLLIVGAISAAITIALNPIMLIMVAIGAAVALLKTAWDNNWGGIQEKTTAVVGFLRGLIETFLTNLRAWWDDHGEAIVATAKKAWELIQGLIDGVVDHIQLVVAAFRAAFEGDWHRFGEIIYEIWENAWETVVNFLSGLWDMVLPWLLDLWDNIRTWFSTIDWGSLGRNIIDGIVGGLKNAAGALYDAIVGIIQGVRDAAGGAAGEGSPATLFIPLGVSIADGIIAGIQSRGLAVIDTIEELVKGASSFGNLAGGFADIFAGQSIAPAQALLDELTGKIGNYQTSIEEMVGALGLDVNSGDLRAELMMLARLTPPGSDQNALANTALGFLDEKHNLLMQQLDIQKQLEEQQNKLLRLEMQRQQLNFLQQQFGLLKLINENGLDPALLSGIQLGANADPEALMNAMIGAMGQMINNTAGAIQGVGPGGVSRSLADEFFAAGRGGGMVVNIDARGASPGVEQDVRRVVEQVLRDYGTRADIRMRTG